MIDRWWFVRIYGNGDWWFIVIYGDLWWLMIENVDSWYPESSHFWKWWGEDEDFQLIQGLSMTSTHVCSSPLIRLHIAPGDRDHWGPEGNCPVAWEGRLPRSGRWSGVDGTAELVAGKNTQPLNFLAVQAAKKRSAANQIESEMQPICMANGMARAG